MQPLYTTLKVNNEIELCEVSDPDCKQLIERALLKNRISGTQLKRSYVGSVTSPDIMSALF